MPSNRILTTIALVTSIVPALAAAEPKTFVVRPDGGSRIQFLSDAPLETINGVSTRISGTLTVDPASVSGARGTLTAQTNGLRTGIDLRDEHLRSDTWLDSHRFPNSTFEITSVEGGGALTANQQTQVRVRGRFTLHGVTKDVVATARVRWMPVTDEMRQQASAAPTAPARLSSDVLRINATFDVNLTDYNVSVPAIVRLKVSNTIRINVNLRAVAQ